jgi:flagellar hook-associated protein 1 FlgK
MRSTFFGLNIGYKGLAAQQRALDVTSHNIANANTPGYTRQDVIMEPTPAQKVLEGYVGTGVTITDFRRIRDSFIDIQMRTENRALGEWETKDNIIKKLEVIFNEPSDTSIRSVLDQFWEAWQTLSKNPESVSVRTDVMQRGVTLANTFNHLDAQFLDLQMDINKEIGLKVNEINTQARQIRDLNIKIMEAESGGHTANDLRDKRDMLVEQLAKNIGIDVVEDELGAVNILVGGQTLVSRAVLAEIQFNNNSPLNPTAATLEWYVPANGTYLGQVKLTGGILKGYVDMRDSVIPAYQAEVSELVKAVAEEVNALHRIGFGLDGTTEVDFFTTTDGSLEFNTKNIQVNSLIQEDINLIAAAATDDPEVYAGDNSNALAIAALKNKLAMNNGVASFNDFYMAIIGKLGVQGQESGQMVANRSYIIEQLMNQRESVSGVSLDEEMTNMIKYQHAYSAAARIITAMDQCLETLIFRLGVVGR